MSEFDIIKTEDIQNRIYTIRGIQVMLDNDIAEFYGVETKRLNEQVKRNIGRFPEAFMFQLSETDFNDLKSQFATSSWGGRRKIPYAFTEQGVAMLSALLGSETAVKMSVQIMSAFVASLKDLGKKWFAFSMFDKEAISILSKLPGGNI